MASSDLPVPSLEQQMDSMPLVDEDAVEVSDEEAGRVAAARPLPAAHEVEYESNGFTAQIPHETRIESMPSSGIGSPSAGPASLDTDLSPDEAEERERLIQQVMELQNTLGDLSVRVDSVKEENLKLRSENQVLGQYIENLMSASNVFQSTSPSKSSSGSKKGKK